MAYKNFVKTEIIDEIGAELRTIRKEKDETLSFVASTLEKQGFHLSATMLGRIETAERRLDDDLFTALCDHYLVNPDELIIRACKAHINTLSKNLPDGDTKDYSSLVEQLFGLSIEHQNEIRTMIRLFAYMDKFKELELN